MALLNRNWWLLWIGICTEALRESNVISDLAVDGLSMYRGTLCQFRTGVNRLNRSKDLQAELLMVREVSAKLFGDI